MGEGRGGAVKSFLKPACLSAASLGQQEWVSSHGHWLCLPPMVKLLREEYPPGPGRAPRGRP